MKTRLSSRLQARIASALPVFLWLVGVLLVPASARAERKEPDGVRQALDIPYGHDRVRQSLDVFAPLDAKGAPVVILVHGGTWMFGDKNFRGRYRPGCQALARQGVVMVSINYRLSPGVKHPEHVKDVARAFAWTVKNIEKYGGRTDQIFVSGHSAGGHLVALLATDETYLKAEGCGVKNIKGVIALSGVYEVPPKVLPQVFGTDEEVRKKASPTYHARAGLPPFLIVYGDKDLKYCDKEPAQAFAKALNDKGTPATVYEVPECNHILVLLSASSADAVVSKKMLEFIRAQTAK